MRATPKQELTPMFRQYFEIKSRYSDCILFFRLGDFYEMFFEDAQIVAPLLGLVLTKREAGKDLTAPMCGIPVEKSDFYVQKLLDHGFKVAICEQVEDPALAKGLVKREVVKVYTPGLFTEWQFLKEGEKTYLASLYVGKKAGLAFLELSCEELIFTELPIEKAIGEILKKEPKELLLEERLKESPLIGEIRQSLPQLHLTFLESSHFKKAVDFDLPLASFEEGLCALSAIKDYLFLYQPSLAERPLKPIFYYPEEYLYLDENAKRSLELIRNLWDNSHKYSLFWVLNRTQTPMGSRLLKEWILYPLRDRRKILLRQQVIDFFLERKDVRASLQALLRELPDLERLAGRLGLRLANPKELALLRVGLRYLPRIKKILESSKGLGYPSYLEELLGRIGTFKEVLDLLEKGLVEDPPVSAKEGGIIREGYSPEVDELRALKENSLTFLAKLEAELRLKTGIPTLKLGYNRVTGYYIEVSKSYLRLVPSYFERKQTLSGVERYVIPELKELEAKILTAEDRLKELEYQLFVELRDRVQGHSEALKETAKAIAELDVLIALSQVAEENNYTCPEITEERLLLIEEGRHPVLERTQGQEQFIPNSLLMKEGEAELLIITGPNMGGKSTYLRQTALIAIMAQMGSFVPAKRAIIPLFDRIFTRIGAGDELIRGKSTFMVEMSECARILREATYQSLVILDEVGRGTSTFDGMALAWAIAEYLYKKRVFTLLATHYFELTELGSVYPGIRNYHVEVREWQDQVIFLYKVLPGSANQSYGIEVARLAGVPEEVWLRAKEILNQLEQKKPKLKRTQLTLFSEDDKTFLIDRIRNINPDEMSPIEALKFLYELKRSLENKKRS